VKGNGKIQLTEADSTPLPANAEEFAASIERRRQAADGLEQDLLNDVPLLYGAPGGVGLDALPPQGDPGIVLARIHREEMLRRNGYNLSGASGNSSEVSLPFERATAALALILFLITLFWN
jgi:hypothetical protein